MLTKVSVQSPSGGLLELPMTDITAGYVIRDIQGLDPVKATLTSSSFAQMDGAQLHNARREPRNILMKLGLEANYVSTTVAGLRSNLYRYMMPKTTVVLGFYVDDVLFGTTEAVVESMDNNMFSADPEVDFSFISYDPDFYAPDSTTFSGYTVSDTRTEIIDYDGTSDTGIIFSLQFPGPASEVVLHNSRPDQVTNTIDIDGSFLAGDILQIITIPGKKAVNTIRGGTTIPSLYYRDQSSSWISLGQGENRFRAYYSGSPIPYTLEFTEKYGGF
jgi:Siphovirus-type tail component, C-terminal domain